MRMKTAIFRVALLQSEGNSIQTAIVGFLAVAYQKHTCSVLVTLDEHTHCSVILKQ